MVTYPLEVLLSKTKPKADSSLVWCNSTRQVARHETYHRSHLSHSKHVLTRSLKDVREPCGWAEHLQTALQSRADAHAEARAGITVSLGNEFIVEIHCRNVEVAQAVGTET